MQHMRRLHVKLILPALTEALPSPWDTDVGKFLPINAGRALFAVRPSTDLLSPGQALLALLATVGVVLALATLTLVRRDA